MNWDDINWPDVQRYFAIEKAPNFWELINSPFFVTVVVGVLGLILQRRIRRDIETTTEVQQTIQRTNENVVDARPEIEAIVENAAQAGANVPDFRSEATTLAALLSANSLLFGGGRSLSFPRRSLIYCKPSLERVQLLHYMI